MTEEEMRGLEFVQDCCRERGTLLEEIADLAHEGGTANLDPYEVLVRIRQLTLDYWRPDEHRRTDPLA